MTDRIYAESKQASQPASQPFDCVPIASTQDPSIWPASRSRPRRLPCPVVALVACTSRTELCVRRSLLLQQPAYPTPHAEQGAVSQSHRPHSCRQPHDAPMTYLLPLDIGIWLFYICGTVWWQNLQYEQIEYHHFSLGWPDVHAYVWNGSARGQYARTIRADEVLLIVRRGCDSTVALEHLKQAVLCVLEEVACP
jgi:hypothetical protein